MSDPRVAVVFVSYNTRELTLASVASALDAEGVDTEVWVVDNASTDGSAAAVRTRFPDVRLVTSPVNVGFGRGNNLALNSLDAPFVLLLNSDAVFADGRGLRRLVDELGRDGTLGVVGPRLQAPSGELEYSARAFPRAAWELARGIGVHRWMSREIRERHLASEFRDHARRGSTDWVTGACMLLRGAAVKQVGGFDPAIFLYGEEMELCWRIRKAGWGVLFAPDVTVVHHRGASGGALGGWRLRLAMAGDAYVVRKHRGWAYFWLFFAARCVGLAGAAVLQGLLGLVTGDAGRRRRSRDAFRSLGGWLRAVALGGARRPDTAWLLPPRRQEAP